MSEIGVPQPRRRGDPWTFEELQYDSGWLRRDRVVQWPPEVLLLMEKRRRVDTAKAWADYLAACEKDHWHEPEHWQYLQERLARIGPAQTIEEPIGIANPKNASDPRVEKGGR